MGGTVPRRNIPGRSFEKSVFVQLRMKNDSLPALRLPAPRFVIPRRLSTACDSSRPAATGASSAPPGSSASPARCQWRRNNALRARCQLVPVVRGRGLWAHGDKRGLFGRIAGAGTGSA